MFRTFYSRLVSPSLLKNVTKVETFLAKNYANDRPLIEKGINQVILMGRCGTDAVRKGSDSRPVGIFSLATHTHYRNQQTSDIQQKTEWHRIVVFKPHLLEKIINFAKKGSRLLVQGKISYGEVSDSNGNMHQMTSIVADDIIFLSSGRVSEQTEVEEESDEIVA